MATADHVELVARHGGHHYDNIKYGYVLFALSIIYLVFRQSALIYYHKAWIRSGRSTTNLGLVNTPMVYTVSIMSGIILILEFFNLNIEEYGVHLKRFGRLAYALTPLDLVLAVRPSPFQLDNYLDTLTLHKWVSRIILALGILHSMGYLVKWLAEDTLEKSLRLLNFYGVIIFVLFDVLLSVSWRKVRSINYTWFIGFHNVVLFAYVVLIQLHARPGVTLLFLINMAILAYQYVVRLISTKSFTTEAVLKAPDSNLEIVQVPRRLLPAQFLPGCHMRISRYSLFNPLFWLLPSHPYTVASVQENTGAFAKLVVKETRFKIEPFEKYWVQPYFRSSLSLEFFQTAENVTIVCGGSGISFGTPIFSHLLRKQQVENKDIKLSCIWITPNVGDLFVLKELEITGIKIYVTRSATNQEVIEDPVSDEFELQTLEDDFQIQDEETGVPELDAESAQTTNTVHYGRRPDLGRLFVQNVNRTIDYANKWIVSCGPPSLNEECKRLADSYKCRYFGENYAM
ncbi:hypothetical protein OGAPHI_006279 [Ogataea philodendri]|uniref:Probable metalloreductase AIM14 n=1 Tax=Ogataea philodendri TaxID=1378263 RepID=A0A9P8NY76_9ASCO|nr:uncharacterized protein OGAPHI_006279 [Ogataea philodendri]KAH3662098.1 hypothetical protein OGAPHI_006279 [Ogataea philodendri]